MKGIVFMMSVAAAIQNVNTYDDQLLAPDTAKKIMMLSMIMAWTAAVVLSIMFICCGFNGYTKDADADGEKAPRVPGTEEVSSLMQNEA